MALSMYILENAMQMIFNCYILHVHLLRTDLHRPRHVSDTKIIHPAYVRQAFGSPSTTITINGVIPISLLILTCK